jgi:hypothetical protein
MRPLPGTVIEPLLGLLQLEEGPLALLPLGLPLLLFLFAVFLPLLDAGSSSADLAESEVAAPIIEVALCWGEDHV